MRWISVFRYLKLFYEEGAEALLVRKHGGGRKPILSGVYKLL
jgi:hypothetical protein